MEFVCIVCPRGCHITVSEKDGEYEVSGNSCKRGRDFAVSEMTDPKRTVCSTVRTVFEDIPVLPVRVSCDIPKDRIPDVMREIKKVRLTERKGRGEAIIEDVLSLGADVISESDMLVSEIKQIKCREEDEK